MNPNTSSNSPSSGDAASSIKNDFAAAQAKAGEFAKETADRVAEKGGELAENAERVAVDAYTSIKRFAEEQPLLAIAAVAVCAVAAGAVINRMAQPSRKHVLDELTAALEPTYRAMMRKF